MVKERLPLIHIRGGKEEARRLERRGFGGREKRLAKV